MSDIPQRTSRGNRKFRIWFSYILFSSLIVFDIFAILNTIEPLVSRDSVDEQTNNSSMVEMTNHTSEEEVIHLVKELKDFDAANNVTLDLMSKMEIYLDWVALTGAQETKEVIMATLEVLAIAILLLFNLLALLGLKLSSTLPGSLFAASSKNSSKISERPDLDRLQFKRPKRS